MDTSLSLIVLLIVLVDVVQLCEFPEYMQSRPDDQTRREWYTHIMENGQDTEGKYELIISFHRNRMRATETGASTGKGRSQSYSRQCLLAVGDKFLVSHKASHKTDEVFMCMEFIKRSNEVVQVKRSKYSPYQDPTLCSENRMFLNDWPFINRGSLYKSYQPCPLVGGYSVKLFDKRSERGVCDAFNGETRVESECMKGEGMYFRFRHLNCVPDKLGMSEHQKTFCIGTWEDDKFTYSVLRHDKEDRLWCLRYPTDNSGAFRAYLFRDLFCERSEIPTKTNQYIAIDFVKEPARTLPQLCADDYEACDFWRTPCRHAGSTMQMTCAKRCGVCSASYPATCTLPTGVRGHWMEQNRNGRENIDISDMFFTRERQADFRCVQWQYTPFEKDVAFMEQMFVATFDNGCRPRYTCAQFKKHTASVMRYKMSEPQIWPFKDANALAVGCAQTFKYKDAVEPFGDTYQSRHFKILVSTSERVYSNCRLEAEKKFHVSFQGGSECDGVLTDEGFSAKNKLKLVLNNCPGMPKEQHFGCLDSSGHGYISKMLIVTETIDSQNNIRCWMFPSYPEYTFYMLPLSHCNEGINEKITSGQFTPMATFKEVPPTTTTTTTTTAGPKNVVIDEIIRLDNQKYQKSPDSDEWALDAEHDDNEKDADGVKKEYSIDYADTRSGKLQESLDSNVSTVSRTNVGMLLVCIVTALWATNNNR